MLLKPAPADSLVSHCTPPSPITLDAAVSRSVYNISSLKHSSAPRWFASTSPLCYIPPAPHPQTWDGLEASQHPQRWEFQESPRPLLAGPDVIRFGQNCVNVVKSETSESREGPGEDQMGPKKVQGPPEGPSMKIRKCQDDHEGDPRTKLVKNIVRYTLLKGSRKRSGEAKPRIALTLESFWGHGAKIMKRHWF